MEVRDDEAGVSQEARRAEQRREGVRIPPSNRIRTRLDGRFSSGVGLGVPHRKRREERGSQWAGQGTREGEGGQGGRWNG